MSAVWNPIPFSITAEDVAVVQEALGPRSGDVLLCIGSSGDTPLVLLANDVARINVIDASFPQLCLAILKAEAMRELSLPEYRELLGVMPDRSRALSLYERVHPRLPAAVGAFWRRHQRLLRRGVIWQGGLIRHIAMTRAVLGAFLGAEASERLSRCETPAQASALLDEWLSSRRGRVWVALSANPVVRMLYYPDKAFRHLPDGKTAHGFLAEKARQMLCRRPLAGNPYLFPFVFGRYASLDCVPPYLSETHYEVIRARVDRLRFLQVELRQHLREVPARTYQGLALSNVVDWMSQEEIHDLLAQVARAGAAGARATLFSRSSTIEVPPALSGSIEDDAALAARLLEQDRTSYYDSLSVMRVLG